MTTLNFSHVHRVSSSRGTFLLRLPLLLVLSAGLSVLTSPEASAQNSLPGRVSVLENTSLKLIGMDSQATDVELTPTPGANGRSQYLSDILAKVLVPASATRTHLILVAGASYGWHQTVSAQPYECGNAVVVYFKSAALTNAGLSTDTVHVAIGTDQQFEESASTVGVTRGKDPTWTIGVPVDLLAAFLKFAPRPTINGQPITDAQALELANLLMHSQMEIQVKVRAGTRSVDSFEVGQGLIQVWADGN
jgi:hypothetical protein